MKNFSRRWRRFAFFLCPILTLISVMFVTAACARQQDAAPSASAVTSDTPTPPSSGQTSEGTPSARVAGVPASTAQNAPPTLAHTPTPPYPGTYSGTPTPNPTPIGYTRESGAEVYIVQPGETLSLIAAVFGCTIEEIVQANNLSHADAIRAGQRLYIPVGATETGPDLKLIPDSEMVYGPAYVHFDVANLISDQGSYLADYNEPVEGQRLTGIEIVQLVAQRFSVGPRVLLALLEMQSGWVTQPDPAQSTLAYPIGYEGYSEGLFRQLSWAAMRLNEGYYGWKRGDHKTVRLGNGSRVAIDPTLNPGTAGLQNVLAQISSDMDTWLSMIGPDGFLDTYKSLFGNPFAYTVEPLVPPDLEQPEMRLPWEAGQIWHFTGGPHGGWGDTSGWAALDFVPGEEPLGCAPSKEWATAAAPGWVVRSGNGVVVIDVDSPTGVDGFEQTGWTLLYLHIHAEDSVEAGTYLERGQRIGHPSCEGGLADATHLHFARRYNGEWIPAGSGSIPMVLSEWTAHKDTMPYNGTMTRGDEVRTALECWDDDLNGLLSDNVVNQ